MYTVCFAALGRREIGVARIEKKYRLFMMVRSEWTGHDDVPTEIPVTHSEKSQDFSPQLAGSGKASVLSGARARVIGRTEKLLSRSFGVDIAVEERDGKNQRSS